MLSMLLQCNQNVLFLIIIISNDINFKLSSDSPQKNYSIAHGVYSHIENTIFVSNSKTWSHCGQYPFLVKSAKTLLISLLHSFVLPEGMAPKRGRATQREGQKFFCSLTSIYPSFTAGPVACQHCQGNCWDLLRGFSSPSCHSTISVSGTRSSFGGNWIVRTQPKCSWV